MRKPSPAMIVALLGVFLGLGGVGVAATGGNFILGSPSNSASAQTALTAPLNVASLRINNTNTGADATPLSLVAASGHPALKVNTAVKVASLNADQLDGLDSTGFLRSSGNLTLWYSPWEYKARPYMTLTPYVGPAMQAETSIAGENFVLLSLNAPQTIFGTSIKVKSVTVCYDVSGAKITATDLIFGDLQQVILAQDTTARTGTTRGCYTVNVPHPTVATGALGLWLTLDYPDASDLVNLFAVKLTLGT